MRAGLLSAVRAAVTTPGVAGEQCAYWVPGRIEVLGKHTDYAGGRSLVCAVEQGFVSAAVPRTDATVRVIDVATGAKAVLALTPDLPPPSEAWLRYPATVLRRIAGNFPAARRGADLAFLSDLPPASGMSSSSAFMVAVFLAISDINRLAEDETYQEAMSTREDLAGYLATVENGQSFGALTGDRGVGTFGGSEDHTAMLCCRAGELSQYAFCPVRHERQVRCPSGRRFVVAVSGVKAEKTGAAMDAYNRASLAVGAILDSWRTASGRPDVSLAEAVDRAGVAQVREVIERTVVEGFSTAVLLNRFDQFVEESVRIIPMASEALAAGDLKTFGALVDRSQDLSEKLLGNQVPETVMLARSARDLGADAASAFGAGFGGSVWALVPEGAVEAFRARWEAAYRAAFPAVSPMFLVTSPGPAATKLRMGTGA
jgi:galactokinase